MKASVAIIVLNWQQPKLTLQTLNSLLRISHPDFKYQIYLIDNGSTDSSFDIFQKNYRHHSEIKLIKSPTNLMFAAGNNLGIRQAIKDGHNYILLINNDVQVDTQFLEFLVTYLEDHPDTGAVGPKIYFAPGFEFHRQRYKSSDKGKVLWSYGGHIDWANVSASNIGIDQVDRGQFSHTVTDIDYISGCCLLIRSQLLSRTALDEKYCMYLEDVELCQRIKKAGYKLAILPASKIWHLNSGSTQSGGGSLHDYFLTRNRLIFGFSHCSFRTKIALFRQSLNKYFSYTKWQKRAVLDFYLHRWGKGSWK